MKIPLGNEGSSLPELIATVGVIGILLAVSVLGLSRRFLDLEATHQELTNVIREMRLRSTIKGAHYRLTPMTTSYGVSRLRDDDADGLWEIDPDAAPQHVELPPGITIGVTKLSGGNTSLEFDTRGVAVDPLGQEAEVVQLTLTDAKSETRAVEVWPSGQVQREPIVPVSP